MGNGSATAGAGAAVAEQREMSEAEIEAVADGLVADMETLGAVTARRAVAEHLAVRELHDTRSENARLHRQLAAARMILRERGEQLPASADDDEAADVGPAAQRHLSDGAAEKVRAFRELENDWIGGVDLIRIDVSVPMPMPSGDSELLTPDSDGVYSRNLVVRRGQADRVLDRLNATLDGLDPLLPATPPAADGDEEEARALLHPEGEATLQLAERLKTTHFANRLPLVLRLSTFGNEFRPAELPMDVLRLDCMTAQPDAIARAINGLWSLALALDPQMLNTPDLMVPVGAETLARKWAAEEAGTCADDSADDGDETAGDGGGAADAVLADAT